VDRLARGWTRGLGPRNEQLIGPRLLPRSSPCSPRFHVMAPFPPGTASGNVHADGIPEVLGLPEVPASRVPLDPRIGAAQRPEGGWG
jgi:hypothetical protein